MGVVCFTHKFRQLPKMYKTFYIALTLIGNMSYTYESGEDLKRAILISPIFEKICDGHHTKPQPLKTNS